MKKRTRDPERTRAHILEVAFGQVYAHGFQGVSVDDIVAKTGLTKGAFFHHFPSKDHVGHAIIDEVLTALVRGRWLAPLESCKNPVEGITRQLEKIIEQTPEKDLALGCPLNNLTQEMSAVDPVFRKKLTAVLEFWVGGVEGHLRRAQKDGYLSKKAHPRQVAEFVVMAHEGAYGLTKNIGTKELFWSLHRSLAGYLESVSA